MNKSRKIIAHKVASLILSVISVSLFGLFASWAWSQLDPAQQEIIGAISTTWAAALKDRTLPPGKLDAVPGDDTPDGRSVTTIAGRRQPQVDLSYRPGTAP